MPDEARRLVWADELIERGDPRGELITTQCALERGDLPRDVSIRLRRREAELFETALEGPSGLAEEWYWRRGAVEEIVTTAEGFLEHREELFDKAPFLHRLRFTGLPCDPREAAALVGRCLEDDRIDGLALGTAEDPALVVELAEHLPRLESVELGGLSLGMVMRNEGLRNVEELHLTSLWDPFSARSDVPATMRPRKLWLQSHSQQKETIDLDALAHPDFFSRLEDLSLEWFVRPNVLVRSSSGLFRRLRKLRAPMGIAASPLSLDVRPGELADLEELSISFFGNEEEIDFSALRSGEYFRKLRVLRIGPGLTTDDEVRKLLDSPLARTLELLDLRQNRWRLGLQFDWDGLVLL